MWPSLWQVLQLYHWLNDRVGVVEEDLAAAGERRLVGPPSGIVRTTLGRLGVDDLDGVGEVVGDVERLAVGGEGQLGRPAAERRRGGTGRRP